MQKRLPKTKPRLPGSFRFLVLLSLPALYGCKPEFDKLRDHPWFDRRIEETPREKVIRECRQESERFRVACAHCHTTEKESEIKSPDQLLLTDPGKRARIMRVSPTFGLHRQCGECHQSKFKLNHHAEILFGPGGEKRKELEQALEQTPVK